MPETPPWPAVTAAFDGELRAWEAYAAEARAWADALRERTEAGQLPSEAHVRVGGGEEDPALLLERTEWIAETAASLAERLRTHLADGDIRHALWTVLDPSSLGARALDFRAPSFFYGPHQPGDLRAPWTVSDDARTDELREALLPEEAPAWFLQTLQPGSRPVVRWLWTPFGERNPLVAAYAEHLRQSGNPWAL